LLALLPGVMTKASSACLRPLDSTAVPTMVSSQVVSRRGPVSCRQGVQWVYVVCTTCADVACSVCQLPLQPCNMGNLRLCTYYCAGNGT
jgi:hypothetical protein